MHMHANIRSAFTALALGSVFLAGGCTTLEERAANTQFKRPPNVELMDESTIRSKIVGNTLTGKSRRGPTYTEYYALDGTIKGLWGDEPYHGKWAVSGSVWCARYQNSSDCYLFSTDGNRITWHELNGNALPNKATLLPGNAKGL